MHEHVAYDYLASSLAKARRKHPGGLGSDPMSVMIEEIGEVARARLDGDVEQMIVELGDVAAVCIRWQVELLRRQGETVTPAVKRQAI